VGEIPLTPRVPQPIPAELAERINMDIPEEWFNEVRIRAQEFTGTNMNLCVELKKPQEAARALWMLAQGYRSVIHRPVLPRIRHTHTV